MSALGDQDKRIKVAIRTRPMHPVKERYDSKCVRKVNETDLMITSVGGDGKGRMEQSAFSFDYAFDEDDQQIEIYNEAVLDLVDATLDGHNATVLAYGQTGSGKTFTMLGEVDETGDTLLKPNSGLFLRVLTDLFLYKERCAGHMHVAISLSIIEIYIQEVRDLLNSRKVLKVQTIKDDINIPDLTIEPVNNLKDVFKYFKMADKQRVAKKTAMNDQSSRSHALFMIDLFQQAKTPSNPQPLDFNYLRGLLHGTETGKGLEVPITKSRICLVDLAGSERISRSEVTGKEKTEAIAINLSLTVLGTVVTALYRNSKHIAFRDSALTLTLKSVFTDPNCKVLLCANLSPASGSFSETKSTLTFANKVKEIKATSVSVDPQAEIEYLERLRKLEELCGDLRIAAVLHEFILQTPARIKHVPMSNEKARAELLRATVTGYNKELAKRKAIKEQQEEDEIHRLANEISEKQIKEMQGQQQALQLKIDQVTSEIEQLQKDVVQAENEKKGEVEAKTNEAKKIRRNRRNAEDKNAKLVEENKILEGKIEEMERAVLFKGGEMDKDHGSFVANTKAEEEEAQRAETYHASAQEMYDNLMHLRNHQLDYLRHKIACAEITSAQTEQAALGYPFISQITDWMLDRAMRISHKQASFGDGETCEHVTRILPMDQWPNALSLKRTQLPFDEGEEVIDAPYDSDYESDNEGGEVESADKLYSEAAAKIGQTPAALASTAQPVQYDFMSAKVKKQQEDKRRMEEEARVRQRAVNTELARSRREHTSEATKPYDEEEKDKHYLMSIYDQDHLVTDLLRYLHCGTVLVKHGRNGKPHKRKFWIESKSELVWVDDTAPNAAQSGKGKRSISLGQVTGIILGMYSKVFKRGGKVGPQTDGFYQAFTLVINKGKRTIDLVAETVSEFEAWLLGLSNLLDIEPVWGEEVDVAALGNAPDGKKETDIFKTLQPREQENIRKHHIRPSTLVTLRKLVTDKRDEVVSHSKLFNGDMAKVFQHMGGIHPPSLDYRNALLMTKGELRYYSNIDIFRTIILWKLFEEAELIYDPVFRLPTRSTANIL